MSRSAVRFRWQSQPNQILELLKLIDSNPVYRQTLFPGDALAVSDGRYRASRDIAIEFFKDNLWIRDAERRGLVIRRDGEWEPTALWDAKVTNPVSTLVHDLKSKWEKKEYQKKYNIDRKWTCWTDITDEKLRKKVQKEFPYYFLLRRLCRPGNSNLILPPNPSPPPPQSKRKRRRTRSESASKSSSESGSDSDQDLSSRTSSPPPPIATTSRASASATRHKSVKGQSSSPEVQVQRHRKSRVALPTPADSSSEHESDFSPVELPTPALRRPSGAPHPTVNAAESSTSLRGNAQSWKSTRPSWTTAPSSNSSSDSDSSMSVDIKPPIGSKSRPLSALEISHFTSNPSSVSMSQSKSRAVESVNHVLPFLETKPQIPTVDDSARSILAPPSKRARLSQESGNSRVTSIKTEPDSETFGSGQSSRTQKKSRVHRSSRKGARMSDAIEIQESGSDSEEPSRLRPSVGNRGLVTRSGIGEAASNSNGEDLGRCSVIDEEGGEASDLRQDLQNRHLVLSAPSSILLPDRLAHCALLVHKINVARDCDLTIKDLNDEEKARLGQMEAAWRKEMYISAAQVRRIRHAYWRFKDFAPACLIPRKIRVCGVDHNLKGEIRTLEKLGISTYDKPTDFPLPFVPGVKYFCLHPTYDANNSCLSELLADGHVGGYTYRNIRSLDFYMFFDDVFRKLNDIPPAPRPSNKRGRVVNNADEGSYGHTTSPSLDSHAFHLHEIRTLLDIARGQKITESNGSTGASLETLSARKIRITRQNSAYLSAYTMILSSSPYTPQALDHIHLRRKQPTLSGHIAAAFKVFRWAGIDVDLTLNFSAPTSPKDLNISLASSTEERPKSQQAREYVCEETGVTYRSLRQIEFWRLFDEEFCQANKKVVKAVLG
ncbi:hypothetical protein M231_03497 [Tremella mesenterica]|uniref:Uncharacterized protein n=1 Tax=Tremella mesenterica TaxID=5217 RepID=A0A4V1M464_TREME|nr:hypothetical protein M231_03497 [Tremella mesenterica]